MFWIGFLTAIGLYFVIGFVIGLVQLWFSLSAFFVDVTGFQWKRMAETLLAATLLWPIVPLGFVYSLVESEDDKSARERAEEGKRRKIDHYWGVIYAFCMAYDYDANGKLVVDEIQLAKAFQYAEEQNFKIGGFKKGERATVTFIE